MELKKWYQDNFSDDDLGIYLNDGATFTDLYNAINKGMDIYQLIGVGDSLVRERLFNELAYCLKVEYNVIYDLWINSL